MNYAKIVAVAIDEGVKMNKKFKQSKSNKSVYFIIILFFLSGGGLFLLHSRERMLEGKIIKEVRNVVEEKTYIKIEHDLSCLKQNTPIKSGKTYIGYVISKSKNNDGVVGAIFFPFKLKDNRKGVIITDEMSGNCYIEVDEAYLSRKDNFR